MRSFVPILAFLLALAGCQRADAPGDAPTNVQALAGDGLVLISWDTLPDLIYWIFFQAGNSVSPTAQGAIVIRRALSPRVVAGLGNGTQYAFVMNATHDDSAAGPSSQVVLSTPRLAGDDWSAGASITPQDLKAMAFSGSRFVAVGGAATTFAGDYNYASTNPPGVTAWTPATLPLGFASNLSSVLFNGTFVALGTDGSILTSGDGLTWTLATAMVPAGGMNGIAFGFVGGATPRYVVVGDGGNIYWSQDLAVWNQATSGTVSALNSISLLNGRYIVTGAGGTLLTSLDGVNWTTGFNTGSTLRGVTFSAGSPGAHYVAVGDAGAIVTSLDAITWTPLPSVPVAQDLRSVTAGGASGTRFLAVGTAGTVAYSDDGLTWTIPAAVPTAPNLNRVLFAPGMYLAIGDAGVNARSR